MTSIALRNLGARKLRTFLTALAIVLGVMMVAGTYVLTDTIEQSFDKIFTESNEGVDAVVTSNESGRDRGRNRAPESTRACLTTVQGVDGVEEADGGITDPAGRDHRQGRRAHRGRRRSDLRLLHHLRALRPARATPRAARLRPTTRS